MVRSSRKKNIVNDVNEIATDTFARIGNTLAHMERNFDLSKAEARKLAEDSFIWGTQPMIADVTSFMMQHIRTGDTFKQFNTGELIWESDSMMRMKFGFEIGSKNEGLPALFLEYGTPKIRPNFFMYYAVKNNQNRVMKIMDRMASRIINDSLRESAGNSMKELKV